MTDSAVAPRKAEEPTDLAPPVHRVLDRVALREHGLEIVQAEVTIPKHLQYEISTGRKQIDGQWVSTYKVGLTADGYDHINRVIGVQLVTPRFVHDEAGVEQLNPIHRKDYIYLRMVGIWWNDLGQMVAYGEDVEVDFMRLYHETRLNSTWYTDDPDNKKGKGEKHTARLVMARDKDNAVMLDENEEPIYKIDIPDEQELKALQRLHNLRNFGIRYAYTVAKNRILKVATGIRSLPVDRARPVRIKVYGFRDNLTPQERQERAQQDQEAIFGKAITKGQTLSDEELGAVGEQELAEEAEAGLPGDGEVTRPFSLDEIDDVLQPADDDGSAERS